MSVEDDILNDSGFTTPERRDLRVRVLKRIRDDDDAWVRCWPFTDAYGEEGTVPPQGYDWSGFRDSSYEAILAMAVKLGMDKETT
jgi:hypothetical protein